MGQNINDRAQEDLMRHYLVDMSSYVAFVFLVIFCFFRSEAYLKLQRSGFCIPAGILVVSQVRVARRRGTLIPPEY